MKGKFKAKGRGKGKKGKKRRQAKVEERESKTPKVLEAEAAPSEDAAPALFIESSGRVVAAPKSANPLALEVGFKAFFELLQASKPLESSTAFTNCSALPLINEAKNP